MPTSLPEALWYTRCPVPSPLGIAERLGWLEETFLREGIAIRSIGDSPDRSIRESHFDHHLSWSFRQGGNIPAIAARARGRATRLVGITWTDEFQAIVTRPDSGIATGHDLPGRRFGLPRRQDGIVDFHHATSLKGLLSALRLADLPQEAARIVDIPVDESVIVRVGDPSLLGLPRRLPYAPEVTALLRGEVDAIFVKSAEGVAIANQFGLRVVSEFGFHPDPAIRINNGTPRVLTVDERLATERPDLVARLIAVVARAGAWAVDHPDETRRFVAREIGSSEDAVLAANGPDLHRHLGIGLHDAHIAAIESYKAFLMEIGLIAADFDVASWVDRSFLAHAEPHATAA